MADSRVILLTGAAGIVGTQLRAHLCHRYGEVRLTDRVGLEGLKGNETFKQGDLTDMTFLESVMQGVSGVVHLGGVVGPAFDFPEVLSANIVGTHNVFEAARKASIQHLVYASSAHVVGFYRRGKPLDEQVPMRPNGEYAVSKAYGELLASYYCDNFAMNILSIRIGYVGDDFSKERRLRTWISGRDLMQLVDIGLTSVEGHEVVFGVSDNPEGFFCNDNAYRLGFKPLDTSTDRLDSSGPVDFTPNLESIEDGLVGGGFAAHGFQGDAKRLLKRMPLSDEEGG